MRIVINTLFLISEHHGGTWTYTLNLLRGLEKIKSGHNISILTSPRLAEKFNQIDLEKIIVPLNPERRYSRVFIEQVLLEDYIKKYKPNVFHATGNVLPVRLSFPSIVTIHDFQFHYYPGNFNLLRRMYLSIAMKSAMNRSNKVIAVSSDTKNDAVKIFNVPPEKIIVIHEAGLSEGEENNATDSGKLKEKYRLTFPIILTVASIHPHKNLSRLIEAFARIVNDIPQTLVIVGETFSYRESLNQTINYFLKENSHRVLLTGFIPRSDLLAFYKIADAYVFPSLFEGFGIPALEAMGCGCPVISSNVTALPEIIGDAGQYFEPHNTEIMSTVLKKVSLSASLRLEMKEKGYKRAHEFSWEKMAQETLGAYEQIL